MRRTVARWAATAVAPLILVSAITLPGGPASAKGTVPTIACGNLTATITWTPPLVPGTATSKTDQVTITNATLGSCTTTPSSNVTAASSITATASKDKNGNSCAALTATGGKPTTYKFTIGWNNGGGTSVVTFKGSSTQTSPPGFDLANGKAGAPYKTKTASAKAILSPSSATQVTDCVAGVAGHDVSSVTVTSGNVNL